MDVRLISSIGRQGQFGLDNRLPYHDLDDLRWFQKLTCEDRYAFLIVGGSTYQGIIDNYVKPGGYPLPGRNLIIHYRDRTIIRRVKARIKNEDRSDSTYKQETVDCMSAEDVVTTYGDNVLWVIGGLKIYKMYMPYIQRFYISRVDYDGIADTYFPILNPTYMENDNDVSG